MTKQEIFDKVVLHARTQKQQAIEDYTCKYRTKDGLKCFIGALIPDDKYNPFMEGFIDQFIMESIGILWEEHHRYKYFLRELQFIHDKYDPDKWEIALKQCASNFDLIYTPPE